MKIENYEDLKESLKNGYIFIDINTHFEYSYCDIVLQNITDKDNINKIGWHCYGSSVNKYDNIDFIIEKIFKMTLQKFIKKYKCIHKDKLQYLYMALD